MEKIYQISKSLRFDDSFNSLNKIIDQHNRTFNYARIAINEVCNLKCSYCLPPKSNLNCKPQLTSTEICDIIRNLSQIGVNKIRFTGGEPLLHKDISSLVKCASVQSQIDSINITTNGILLKDKLPLLMSCGLTGVNISIDSLQEEKYKQISGKNKLSEVLSGIDAAISYNDLDVKVNVVVMHGFNHNEIIEFIEYFKTMPITLRFIEVMPFNGDESTISQNFFSSDDILSIIENHIPQHEYYSGTKTEFYSIKCPNYPLKIAVIPSFTRALCENCNRIRITSDGKIMNCLYSSSKYDLLEKIRNGVSICESIKDAMWKKEIDGWVAQKKHVQKFNSMSRIGG